MFGLNKTMTVYTPNGTDGAFDVVGTSGVACRLAFIQHTAGDVGGEREKIGENRRLLWEAAYAMPDDAQVAIDGYRWNVLAGTFGEITGPMGTVLYRRCEVTKVV